MDLAALSKGKVSFNRGEGGAFVACGGDQGEIGNNYFLFEYMDVSENSGTPKSPILIRVFHYKPSILGYPYFWRYPYR